MDEIEPLPEVQSDYRIAALTHMATLKAIDQYMADSEDPRLAWTVCSTVFDLTSTRGLSMGEIAGQIGVSPQTLSRATAEFKRLANVDSAGSIQAIPRRTANTI